MGFFKNRKAEKENEVVIKKVVEIENKNEELSNKIEDNLNQAKKKMDNLEKEKNAKKTDKELADWFNNRKPDNK